MVTGIPNDGDPDASGTRRNPQVAAKAAGQDALGRVTVDVVPGSPTDQLLPTGQPGGVSLVPGTTAAEVVTSVVALASGEFPDRREGWIITKAS